MPVWKPLAGALALAAVGCRAPAPAAPVPPVPYRSHVDVQQLMARILFPVSDEIWDSSGTIITAEGRTELAPTTDEGWERVHDRALLVAELGNLLMLPGRSQSPEWDAYARGMSAAALESVVAAQARDPDALFDAGGRLYQTCKACHDRYWLTDE